MTGICPWGDIGERYPSVLVNIRDIWPARGAWLPSAGVIFIDSGLSRADRRSVLSHEIAHLDLDHEHRGFPWFDARQEREADMLAARRLITVDGLAEAYACTHDDAELAEILNVDVHTVRVRCEHLHPAERHLIAARVARVEHVA